MGQKTDDPQQEAETPGIQVKTNMSDTSRQQREESGPPSVWGKRTSNSDLVFFEGILPESDGNILSNHSIEEQASVCLNRLESMLKKRNVALDNVMKVEIQLTDPDGAGAVDRVYESRFADVEFPPRTVIGVCSLPGGASVQFDIIAADE